MNKIINSLKLLRGLDRDSVFKALTEYALGSAAGIPDEEKYNDLVCAIYSHGAEDNLRAYVEHLVICDENAFSVTAAGRGYVSEYLQRAFLSDLETIKTLFLEVSSPPHFCLGESADFFGQKFCDMSLSDLMQFYAMRGYGKYIFNRAFTFAGGALQPIKTVSDTTLDKLKDYENEKRVIRNNISDFMNGLPFSNMLLYGDKGTGKSSTVHALFNLFSKDGLKIIEVDKKDIVNLLEIKRLICNIPLKFIIFIDDISLEENDERLSTLKAALEGSVSGEVENAMIIATSNRRHIVRESFSDRQNSVHPSDQLEEQLSLSDRFGITVMFSSTDKAAYLSIVRQLATDYSIPLPDEKLCALAERWAILKGGRSPRRAKQFADFAYACTSSGREIEF